MKRTKKIMSLALALVMLLTVIVGSVSVFAQGDGTVRGEFTKGKKSIKGTVKLINVVNHEYDSTTNKGFVGGVVSAKELFKDAYIKYVNDFEGQAELFTGKKYENLVMFDKEEKFPTITYSVTFPKSVIVDTQNIRAVENTATISKIEKSFDEAKNTVTFKLYLGNWNDYKGFFELYKSEKDLSDHTININIPYSLKEGYTDNLGSITASGFCKLYKYGGILGYGLNIVDVSAKELSFSL